MISIDSSDRLRSLRAPGYFILAMAVVFPLVELGLSVSPWHPTAIMWRFGVMGLAASAAGTPLTALFFMYGLALFAGDRNVVRIVSVVAALIALVLILGAGAFVLDTLQMNARVKPQALRQFRYASAQALIKQLFWGTAAIVLAISAFRMLRKTRSQKAPSPNQSILVGRADRLRRGEPAGDGAVVAKPVG